MSDPQIVRLVFAWAVAVLSIVILGAVGPFITAYVVDGIDYSIHRRDVRPLLGFVGAAAASAALGIWLATLYAVPGAPSAGLRINLGASFGAAVITGSLVFAAERAIRRQRARRTAKSARDAFASTLAAERAPGFDRPTPSARTVEWRDAEFLVAEWMVYLGADDATTTPPERDGGVDVRSAGYVAQVKNWTDPVDVKLVRELSGVAESENRRPLFFSAVGYTKDALNFAKQVGMPLFTFRAAEGRLVAANPIAQRYLSEGLRSPATMVSHG